MGSTTSKEAWMKEKQKDDKKTIITSLQVLKYNHFSLSEQYLAECLFLVFFFYKEYRRI